MGQSGVIGAHGVLHSVFTGGAGDDHGIASHRVRIGHIRSGFQITSVLHRPFQVCTDLFHGAFLNHVSHEVRRIGDVPLHIVEQCIESLIGGELRRHRHHQFRVHNGIDREHVTDPADPHLFPGLGIGDDTPAVHLGSGAGGSGDHDRRKGRNVQGFPAAGGTRRIIPQVVPRHDSECRHDLRRIHDGTASQRHHHVASLRPGQPGTGFHHRFLRIRSHPVEQHHFHAGHPELFLCPGQRPVRPGGLPVRNHQQRFLPRHFQRVQRIQFPRSEDQFCRIEPSEILCHIFSFLNRSIHISPPADAVSPPADFRRTWPGPGTPEELLPEPRHPPTSDREVS